MTRRMSPWATTTILLSLLSRSHLLTHLARSVTRSGLKMPSLEVHEGAESQCGGAGEGVREEKSRESNSGSDSRMERSWGSRGGQSAHGMEVRGAGAAGAQSPCRTAGR